MTDRASRAGVVVDPPYDPVEQLRMSILTETYIVPITHQKQLLALIEKLRECAAPTEANATAQHAKIARAIQSWHCSQTNVPAPCSDDCACWGSVGSVLRAVMQSATELKRSAIDP